MKVDGRVLQDGLELRWAFAPTCWLLQLTGISSTDEEGVHFALTGTIIIGMRKARAIISRRRGNYELVLQSSR